MTTMEAALRPVRGRMRALRMVLWASVGLGLGGAAALFAQLAAFLWPVEGAAQISIACALVPPAIGALAGLLWPVGVREAARRADGCGLKARMQTALEWQTAAQTPMLRLQREDAGRALQGLYVREAMPLRASRLFLILAGACLLGAFGLSFVPNPQHQTLKAKAAFRQEMSKQAQHLEDGGKQLDEKDEAALKTRKILGDLARELREAGDPRQALTAMDGAQRKLEKLRQNSAEALRSLLAGQGLTEAADAMEKEDLEELRKALEQTDGKTLAESLEKAAQAAAQQNMSQAVQQSLQNAAQAAAAGNTAQAQASLNAAMTGATGACSQGSALAQMARTAAARAGQPLGNAAQGNLPQALGALGAMGTSGSGSGSGGGMGGIGQGGGAGAGLGSTNLDAGYTNSQPSSHTSGGRRPEEKLGTYEVIYDPTRLGGDGEVANERGVVNQGETTEATLGAGLGSVSESVPYADVAYEYQQSAVEAVENADLPVYVQKWVETYFQSLLK